MELDRRHFSLGVLMALTAACETGASSNHAKASESWWPQFRDRFLAPEGRIVDNGNGGISHSEGQGYGMLFALAAGDRESFAGMARWTADNLARSDVALHSWRYDPRSPTPVADPNNATDGDMLIAWALAQAGQHWNKRAYLDRSTEIRRAIRSKCVLERYDRWLLIPGLEGFVESGQVILNPSYFIWSALDLFARLDGEQVWGKVIADCEDLTNLAKFGPHHLPTDWISISGTGQVAPTPGRPPRFGFDAIRVPLYAVMGRRASLASDIATFWRGCLALNQPIPAWIDVVTGEQAPYPVSSGGAAVASRLIGTAPPPVLAGDYYAACLQMLARSQF